MHLVKNDVVKVTKGNDRGKEGKVIKVFPSTGRILIQGVNSAWKHLRRSAEYPHGARIQKEAPINAANVMLLCPTCNKPTRVGYKTLETGIKNRICKKCNQAITSA